GECPYPLPRGGGRGGASGTTGGVALGRYLCDGDLWRATPAERSTALCGGGTRTAAASPAGRGNRPPTRRRPVLGYAARFAFARVPGLATAWRPPGAL